MHTTMGRRFSPIHVIMLLISCLTLMGCYMGCFSPDWSDKDADFLITQLKNNRHYQLREKAVYLLASKAQERDKVIPALTHALLDDYAYVREAAADVLGSIEPPAVSAIPALIETLRAKDTGRTSMLPVHDEWPDVHWTALMSLRKMGPAAAEAIPALTEVFHSDDERYLSIVKDGAGVAISKIAPSMRGMVIEELIERRVVWPLVWLAEGDDEFLVPVLIQILNDPEAYEEHSRATEELQDIGTPEALDAVVAYYIQRLDHPEIWVRASAARALKKIGTPEALDAAIPALMQLLNDPYTWERLRAAEELKDIGTPEALEAAVPVLIQLLNASETKDSVRERAAEALKDIGTPEALEAVKQFEKPRWWPF